jgi:hypothetical protein
MADFARVGSIEALTDFKTALCTFAEEGKEVLSSVQMAIHRTLDWLEGQALFWRKEARRREEAVIQARAELARRKMMRIGDRAPDCSEQELILRKAQLRWEEAEEKLAATRRWQPALRREIDEYQGPARLLVGFLEGEQPRALALLEHKIDALEAYVQLAASATPEPASGGRQPPDESPESGG